PLRVCFLHSVNAGNFLAVLRTSVSNALAAGDSAAICPGGVLAVAVVDPIFRLQSETLAREPAAYSDAHPVLVHVGLLFGGVHDGICDCASVGTRSSVCAMSCL